MPAGHNNIEFFTRAELKRILAVAKAPSGRGYAMILLGHRSIGNTMIYLSIADGQVDRAVAEAADQGFVV